MEKNRSPLVHITGNMSKPKKAQTPQGKNPKKKRTMNYKTRTLSN